MYLFPSLVYFFSAAALRGTLAGAGVGARALTTQRQTAAVAETAVATDVHQALDVHRVSRRKVTFDGELARSLADLLQIGVGQVLDLLGTGCRRRRRSGVRACAPMP